MRIAVLFNADHPKYEGMYGTAIRDRILGTRIIQNSGRHVKVRLGDVLINFHARTVKEFENLAERVYFSHPWQLISGDKLRATYRKSEVFAWVIENIDEQTARQLHGDLMNDDSYLGMHAVDLTNPVQLVLYRNSLIGMYRISGNNCRVFYSMGSEDDRHDFELEEVKSLGFTDVEWEDRGAHGTIFDNYDTPEHFARVEAFRKMVAAALGNDEADELVLMLEDLSPALFASLGVGARSLEEAKHEEEIAQVAISARRFIEQLADVLFHPQSSKYKGMAVTEKDFKNRILAYIDQVTSEKSEMKEQWGLLRKRLTAVLENVNAAIHGSSDKIAMQNALSELASLSSVLLRLDPSRVRDPYFAFKGDIDRFLRESLERRAKEEGPFGSD